MIGCPAQFPPSRVPCITPAAMTLSRRLSTISFHVLQLTHPKQSGCRQPCNGTRNIGQKVRSSIKVPENVRQSEERCPRREKAEQAEPMINSRISVTSRYDIRGTTHSALYRSFFQDLDSMLALMRTAESAIAAMAASVIVVKRKG